MDKKICIFVGDVYEDLELQYPKYRLIEAGLSVVVAGPEKGEIYKGKHGYPCRADVSFQEVDPAEFAGLIIPGGYAPDKLRMDQDVLRITRALNEEKKPIAFICHGGWIPVSAGILKGVACTSYIAIKDDMENAGALWSDAPVVVDGHIISSRKPDDLPAFCQELLKQL